MRSAVLALALLGSLIACRTPMDDTNAAATVPLHDAPASGERDPWLFLEEVDGERALAWVHAQNERTRAGLGSLPGFDALYRDALAALDSTSRVPSLTFRGPYLYNLWRSEEHPRGIFRRTTLDSLRTGSPSWTTVLDVDELARREGTPWVFAGMTCLPPDHRRCLVSLSPGGGDAVEVRELDAETLRFVEGGFALPLAKSVVSWIDADTILVGTDFGPGSLTESGYPRIVKAWTRGTPLAEAATLYEAPPGSVSASGSRLRSAAGDIDLIFDARSFWTTDVFQVSGLPERARGDGSTVRIQLVLEEGAPYGVERLALPETAEIVDAFRGRLVVRLQDDWPLIPGGRTPSLQGAGLLRAGSVILVDPAAVRGDGRHGRESRAIETRWSSRSW
jgi:prolyl oligopeptidase